MAVKLRGERVKRHIDECECDHCGAPCCVEDFVWVDLAGGRVFCSRECGQYAASDAEHDRGDASGVQFDDEG